METDFKIEPWPHQREDLARSRDLIAAALPWEPRCGKTKTAIDTVAYHVRRGAVDAAVVVAPSGVHLNWTRVELPLHWPLAEPLVIEWDATKIGTKKYQRLLNDALKSEAFVWVVINYEALASTNAAHPSRGERYLTHLVKRRRCALILDESHKIKNPTAKRTRAIHRLAPHCPVRRTLTGTPVAQGPFDLWAQYYALDPDVLGPRFITFKHRYGAFRRMRYGAGPAFDELVEYKNLDDLRARIAPITFPRIKADVLKNLPERPPPQRHYFVMAKEHRKVYNELRDELIARLDDGEEITAMGALTQLLRLQQVSRGHVTLEGGKTRWLDGPQPAVDAAVDLATTNPGKTIFWCRFVADVDLLVDALAKAGREPLRCDGSVPARERPALIARFREDPTAREWVGTTGTGSEGVDLSAADLMVFYSHGYDLVQRVQAMERNYGSNQTAARVDVVDLVAADAVDERALAALNRKENLAAQLTGDKLRELLT